MKSYHSSTVPTSAASDAFRDCPGVLPAGAADTVFSFDLGEGASVAGRRGGGLGTAENGSLLDRADECGVLPEPAPFFGGAAGGDRFPVPERDGVDGPLVEVDGDGVAGAHARERAAVGGFRHDLAE